MAIARVRRLQSLGTLAGNNTCAARVTGPGVGAMAAIATVFAACGTSTIVNRASAAGAAFLLQLNQLPRRANVYNVGTNKTKSFELSCQSRSYSSTAAACPVTSSPSSSRITTESKPRNKGPVSFTTSHSPTKPHHPVVVSARPFSSTTSKMSTQITKHDSSVLLELLANRRSYYKLNDTSPIPDSKIEEILKKIILTVPSAFNTQSTRFVLAVGPAHHKVWDTTTRILRAHMGEERWSSAPTAGKMAGFRAAHGTVLCYDNVPDVSKMKENFPAFKDKFDGWTDHSAGMHQLAAWTALSAEGLGCNLQHYNPIIDADLAKEFNIPEGWELKAQLVFGGIEGGRPDEKDKKSIDELFKSFSS